MPADSRSSRWGICRNRGKCCWYSNKTNRLSWLVVQKGTPPPCVVLFLLLVLTSLTTVGQTPDLNRPTLIHGLIVTAQGRPTARATVEVRDLRGVKVATGITDAAGRFAITMAAKPGEYVLLAAKGLLLADERITLDRADREMTIALPFIAAACMSERAYTVSAQELRVPSKARAHLKLARQKFIKLNFDGSEKEIDRALQVDSIYAAAFSMRALLRLASRDFDGAIAEATHALALDPGEAEAHVALATAYNSLREFDQAETAAEQALGIRPDFWQGQVELAKAFYGQGQLILALRELDELNKDFPDVHLIRANILMRLDRTEEAVQEFGFFLKEALDDPRSEQVRRIVARSAQTGLSSSSFLPR